MISLRLPNHLEKQLNEIAENENLSKSTVIKNALQMFIIDYYNKLTPYDLGKDLFGTQGSSKGNLSADYKKLIKEKLHEKHAH